LLFTNYEQLNFVNINQNNVAKAWVVLFHFRSKSMDSQLYEDFSSLVVRNATNKSKGHELFGQFYNVMLEKSYSEGF